MGLWSRGLSFPNADQMLAERLGVRTNSRLINGDTARRHSAVWACRRLRGDLISTLPIDAYRMIGGLEIEVAKPPMLVNPGGEKVNILEWLYSTQDDLDGFGNTFGLITARNALGLPARIDLVPVESVTVRVRNSELVKYLIGGREYEPSEVWHEKQFTKAGSHVGLSPIMYGALSISSGLSAAEFAANWFNDGAVPTAMLKNTAKTLKSGEATLVKNRFKAAVANHDLFVAGADWDYKMLAVPQNQATFIDLMSYSVVDIARFFGAPADMIDAAVSGQSITYASISQRNLQLLIMNVGPAIVRREAAMSTWLPRGQRVRLNSDALLRMDPETRQKVISGKLADYSMTNDEARALDNKPPLTDEEIARMHLIYGPPKTAATPTGAKA